MGQAIRHFRKVVSLRNDSGRLSLESLLSGSALWLALLYLMQDGAMAAGPAEGARGSSGSDAGDMGLGGAGPAGGGSGEATAGSSGIGSPPVPSAERGTDGVAAGEFPAPLSGPGRWNPPGGATVTAGTPPLTPQDTPAGAVSSLVAGSSEMPWTVGGTVEKAVVGEGGPEPEGPGTGPEIPGFRVVLRSLEGVVSRSVEGVASTSYHNSLGTITDAVIDLRHVATPKALVSSDRQLHLLSLSVLNDAELAMDSQHTGLKQARLLFGPESNDIRLHVSDAIELALLAGGTARGQILQSLIGMLDSQLEDSGGGGVLELSSLGQFHLKAPADPGNRQLGIDLLAEAMQNSSILLGGC
ncbi:hypothetical protein [Synechococcus sp. CCY 9618]|uniref:hypothetical protein n=1 Tax=Synechococcus sp. CCY 9618 TaxID=2815602 RepID=UPI001C231135|nr:hypothetical protein [Synechococcus sp. CCY 9618]